MDRSFHHLARLLLAVIGLVLSAPSHAQADAPADPAAFALLEAADFEAALPGVRALADRGDATGLLYLALMHQVGAAVEIDPEDAREWFRRAASAGSVLAAMEVLVDAERDHPDYERWRELAAAPSQPRPRLPATLATQFLNRLSISPQAAADWSQRAAAEGNVVGLYNVAHHTLLAPQLIGADRNDFPAALTAAGEAGSQRAMRSLELSFRQGIFGFTADPTAADQWLHRLAESGDAQAQYRLGENWQADPAAAVVWLERAAAQNHPKAINRLGDLWQYRTDAAPDLAQALALYQRGAELDEVDAFCDLAIMYHHGRGVPQDFAAALAHYDRAAELGSTWAQYHGAMLRIHPADGLPADTERGLADLRAAAEQGSSEARYQIGWLHYTGDLLEQNPELAFEWFEHAARQGFADAQNMMGSMLMQGIGIAPDAEEALTWWELAAAKGHPFAANNLWSFFSGRFGGTPDEAKAQEWRRRAAEAGSAPARASFLFETVTNPHNRPAAIAAIGELGALSHQHDDGLILYARALQAHRDLDPLPDDDLVQRLLAAYERGQVRAATVAGQFLVYGFRGGPADPSHARELLMAAANAGDNVAQIALYVQLRSPQSPLHDEAAAADLRQRWEPENEAFRTALANLPDNAFAPAQTVENPSPSPEKLAELRARFANRRGDAAVVPLYQGKPVYPFALRAAHITGEVLLSFVVNTEGDPVVIEVVESTDPGFEAAAIAALESWRFAPGRKNGRAVDTRLKVPIVFNILD